jgi:hypothetical protein
VVCQRPLYNCRGFSTNQTFFAKQTQCQVRSNQRKPFYDKQIRDNGHLVDWKNKPNSNPIKPKTKPISEMPKMNLNTYPTMVYSNKSAIRQKQNKPNQTQFQTQFSTKIEDCPGLWTPVSVPRIARPFNMTSNIGTRVPSRPDRHTSRVRNNRNRTMMLTVVFFNKRTAANRYCQYRNYDGNYERFHFCTPFIFKLSITVSLQVKGNKKVWSNELFQPSRLFDKHEWI